MRISGIILIIFGGVSASFISIHSVLWFFPLIFSLIMITGFILKLELLFDIGLLMTIITFLFINRGLQPTPINLVLVMAIFFLLIGVWFITRNWIHLIQSWTELDLKTHNEKISFKDSISGNIIENLFFGVLLSFLGTLIGLNSYMGFDVSEIWQLMLLIGFSSLGLIAMFIIFKLTTPSND